jgi:hypothetical protein
MPDLLPHDVSAPFLVSPRTAVACAMTLGTVLQRKAYQQASIPSKDSRKIQWLMGLAVDAVELTQVVSYESVSPLRRAESNDVAPREAIQQGQTQAESGAYEPGLGAPEAEPEAPKNHAVLPEERLRNLRVTLPSKRPALRVPKGQRREYAAALSAVEWLSSAALGAVSRVKKEDGHRLRAFLTALGKDQALIPEDCLKELQELQESGREKPAKA